MPIPTSRQTTLLSSKTSLRSTLKTRWVCSLPSAPSSSPFNSSSQEFCSVFNNNSQCMLVCVCVTCVGVVWCLWPCNAFCACAFVYSPRLLTCFCHFRTRAGAVPFAPVNAAGASFRRLCIPLRCLCVYHVGAIMTFDVDIYACRRST